jgi:hypothetical protein
MKVALMAEPGGIGNDEPRNWIARPTNRGWELTPPKKQEKMTISTQPIAAFASYRRASAPRTLFALAVLAVVAEPCAAAATPAKSIRAYDGTWNVVFATQAGNCSSTNSAPFTVSGGRLSSAGGGKVTGGINSAGIVLVRISVGLSVANGSGRLVGNSGAGRWSGVITGDRCRGTWQATRS